MSVLRRSAVLTDIAEAAAAWARRKLRRAGASTPRPPLPTLWDYFGARFARMRCRVRRCMLRRRAVSDTLRPHQNPVLTSGGDEFPETNGATRLDLRIV